MMQRTWVRSGIVEDFDVRQGRLLALVLTRVREHYANDGAPPLSLARLMRLCRRNSLAVTLAVKILANSIADGERMPALWYERVPSRRHPAKRHYRITLR